MGVFKQLGSVILSKGLNAFAIGLFLTAMSGTSFAGGLLEVPEIDPAAITGAIAMFTGGVMLLTSKRLTK
jgi:hypothetical protein